MFDISIIFMLVCYAYDVMFSEPVLQQSCVTLVFESTVVCCLAPPLTCS
jgi:hypothetical protein